MFLHLKCINCGFIDIINKDKGKGWKCPNCEIKGLFVKKCKKSSALTLLFDIQKETHKSDQTPIYAGKLPDSPRFSCSTHGKCRDHE